MRVYLIKNDSGVSYYQKDLINIEELWDGATEEETYTITNREMSEEEYDNLPEFDGF